MEESGNWIRFNYKSAIIFFLTTISINLVFTPLLVNIGLSRELSLFILNSLGIGLTFSYILLVVHGMYKGKKQAIIFSSIVTAICTLACYALIYAY